MSIQFMLASMSIAKNGAVRSLPTSLHVFVIISLSAVVALLLALASPAPAAAAKFKASAQLDSTARGTTVSVTLTAKRKVAARQRPKSVTVRVGRRTLKLKRQRKALKKAAYASTWRSSVQKGARSKDLLKTAGKRLRVTVNVRGRKSTYKPKVAPPKSAQPQTPGTPTPGTPARPLFEAPGRDLVGNDAVAHVSRYLLNSAFSDCAAGPWPYCAVENRYVHCPGGGWLRQRASNSPGSDINSYGDFQITGLSVKADGSWAVSYGTNYGNAYYWEVSTDGVVHGTYYWKNDPPEPLGPLYWSQPAVTWNHPDGIC